MAKLSDQVSVSCIGHFSIKCSTEKYDISKKLVTLSTVAKVTNSFEKAAIESKREALRRLDETSKFLLVAMVFQNTGYKIEVSADNIKAALQSFMFERYPGIPVNVDDFEQRKRYSLAERDCPLLVIISMRYVFNF